ncbi:MAG: recombinase family protein [Ramlibacter sp.]|nr:recombinase family protein [Ramlibacter sp.]
MSTVAQDTALQEDAFRRAGVRKVITEKWSSVGQRPQLMALLLRLRPGDTVTVYKLDRLGRSLQDLLTILERIGAAGASFRSLTEPIDTTTPAGKLMYSILGAVAEFEKSLIGERVRAGQVAAYRRGVRFGRRRSTTPGEDACIWQRCLLGERPVDVARSLGVSTSVVYRVINAELGITYRESLPVLGPMLRK